MQVAVVDDVEEDVGGIGAVGEVADLVDDEHVRVDILAEGLAQAAEATGGGEIVDEVGGGGEERGGAVLDGAVGDGDRQVRFPSTGLAHQDEIAPLGDELGAEIGAEEVQAQRGLEGEVEVVDGLQEGKRRVGDGAAQAGLLAVGDLLGDEHGEEVATRPLFGLGPLAELAPDAPGVGQVQALEQRVEVDGVRIEGEIGGHHETSAGKRLSEAGGRPRHWAMNGGGDVADIEGGAEGPIHGLGPDLLQQLVQRVDVARPGAGMAMHELGEEAHRRRARLEQVLALQVPLAARAGDGGQVGRAVLGQPRRRAAAPLALVTASCRPATMRTRSR